VCKYLDYASIAAYDYTGPSDSKTGYNSPLYSRSAFQPSINNSINAWIQKGCPANKMLLGVPTYARAFKITRKPSSQNLVHLGVDSEPFLNPSAYTSEEGVLSYYEVCELMANKETKVYWDDTAMVPFAIAPAKNVNPTSTTDLTSSVWISYDDARSARKKAEFVKQKNLGGVAVWSVDMDDFKGQFCNLGRFPVIEALKQELVRSILDNHEDTNEYSTMLTTKFINKASTTTPVKTTIIKPKPFTKPVPKPTPATTREAATRHLRKFKGVREVKIISHVDRFKHHERMATSGAAKILVIFNVSNILLYSFMFLF